MHETRRQQTKAVSVNETRRPPPVTPHLPHPQAHIHQMTTLADAERDQQWRLAMLEMKAIEENKMWVLVHPIRN